MSEEMKCEYHNKHLLECHHCVTMKYRKLLEFVKDLTGKIIASDGVFPKGGYTLGAIEARNHIADIAKSLLKEIGS